MLANFIVVFVVIILFLFAYILVRTILYGQAVEPAAPVELPEVEGAVVAEHLAAAVRHATVSQEERARIDPAPFLELRHELERMYPRAHTALKVEAVNRYSLLYTWMGRDSSLPPVLLSGHLDVVPVDPATRDEWKYPPFEGRVADGCVWGRGALDTKSTVIAALEAVETLLITGYQPERTLYLAFGHDEEISGLQGAAQIAGRLFSSGIRLEALLDEGGGIIREGLMPGLHLPVALVGVAEKGYLSLALTAEGRGGHSSMPPRHTSIGVIARAIARLEEHPLPARLEIVTALFRRLGAYLPFWMRALFANLWLFQGVVLRRLSVDGRTNALLRSTTAVTLIGGGIKENLLPARAQAAVNIRLLPGDRIAEIEKTVREVIRDEAVQIHIEGSAWEASPISSFESPAALGLRRALGQAYPEAVAAPYLVAGATDSHHYTQVCENIFRISPYMISLEDVDTVHGNNERITIDALARMVQFYIQLVKIWTERVSD